MPGLQFRCQHKMTHAMDHNSVGRRRPDQLQPRRTVSILANLHENSVKPALCLLQAVSPANTESILDGLEALRQVPLNDVRTMLVEQLYNSIPHEVITDMVRQS